ncbi:hypothetical protein HKK80_11950 [Halonotius sp. F2-221B]|uniref:protein adenylyltransferase SelO family protein n=1 Tax=Halonotius sp. F2-221B TaxID=2731620 RepID=UPI00398B3A13
MSLNYYDEDAVFSSVDEHGRYAFGNQRQILNWNLARFAESLQPLCEGSSTSFDEIKARLDVFDDLSEVTINWIETQPRLPLKIQPIAGFEVSDVHSRRENWSVIAS